MQTGDENCHAHTHTHTHTHTHRVLYMQLEMLAKPSADARLESDRYGKDS